MKKIIVQKSDTVSMVVRKMLATLDQEIILVIPKSSKLAASLNNFHILNREAEAAGKKLAIESVDEEVLAYAREAGLASDHPFLNGLALRDIVPRTKGMSRHFQDRSIGELFSEERKDVKKKKVAEESFSIEEQYFKEIEEKTSRRRVMRSSRGFFIAAILGGVVLVGFVLAWVVSAFWGRAEVTLKFKEIPWSFTGIFTADATVSKPDSVGRILPAEVFTLNRNITQSFPATGSENVVERARGTLTIYNAYSSSPQTFVAATRFEAPDGKIFRLEATTVVSGALIRQGGIIPASTTAVIVADKAGEAYNIGPVARLTIPGFRGTPKFSTFYGALPSGTKGGFVGVTKVPTAQDVTSAKAKAVDTLRASLEGLFITTKPDGFKIPEGASTFVLGKMVANEAADSQGNFDVFGEATLTAIGFRELDLKTLVVQIAEQGGGPLALRSIDFTATSAQFSSGSRKATFTSAIQAVLVPVFSPEDFKVTLRGLSVNQAQTAIARLQGLEEGKVSLWPFWISNVPENSSHIVLTVE